MNNTPIRCGDRVRMAAHWCDSIRAPAEMRQRTGTVVWVDRTSSAYTLVHVAWNGDARGATRLNIRNIERVEP